MRTGEFDMPPGHLVDNKSMLGGFSTSRDLRFAGKE